MASRVSRGAVLLACVATVLGACSSAPAGPAGSPSTGPLPTASPAVAEPSSAPPTSAASAAQATEPVVDLTFTGTVPLTAKGPGGTCILGHDANGDVSSFGWMASEADFPGLGDSLAITEVPGGDDVDVKWSITSGLAFFGRFTGGVTLSPDHRLLGLDADLPPSGDATEHVRGTIVCP